MKYWIFDINPEPWRVPGVPHYGKAVKDGKLESYQQAIREALEDHPDRTMHTGLLTVKFHFWRSTAHNKPADATNLQKATEDALQKVLFGNDRENRHVSSTIWEQLPTTIPTILIDIQRWNPLRAPIVPPRQAVGKFEGSNWVPPVNDPF